MRILISNDDGVDAPGLNFLAEKMQAFGEVFVVAPDRERSGCSHSLTLLDPLRIHKLADRRYSIDGTPTDCVNLALKTILKDKLPDLVLSGINRGPNLGDDITYSGTVAAALEGALMGIPSAAFSLAMNPGDTANYEPAVYFAAKLVQKFTVEKWPCEVLLNVNVPNVKGDRIDDYEVTRMGRRHYSFEVAERVDPRKRRYYWIGADDFGCQNTPESDCLAVKCGKVSVTPLRFDLTHDIYLEKMKHEWKL